MFSSRFMLFPTLKKNLCKKKFRGGGGGGCCKKIYIFFLEKQLFLISNNFEKFPFTYWLNSGDGGGVNFFLFFFGKTILSHFTFYAIFNIKKKMFFSHLMLFTIFLEKIILGIQLFLI